MLPGSRGRRRKVPRPRADSAARPLRPLRPGTAAAGATAITVVVARLVLAGMHQRTVAAVGAPSDTDVDPRTCRDATVGGFDPAALDPAEMAGDETEISRRRSGRNGSGAGKLRTIRGP